MLDSDMQKLTRLAQERGEPFRVLIVDDEKWVRDVFRDFCGTTDAFRVDLADSGLEALAKVEATPYDLITVDLIMPEMSGLEVLSEIKKRRPRTPVVVITGNATDKLVHKAGLLGACRVMYKPVQLEDFISEISSALSR
ncbi:MAG TPA: response regulator [candidate division Zixibacteria bacterium]|nr:response regulator [candidate division Zixibacteria bacterium]MDD4916838.1 response regulator [candidate division Zixibacteria bacterium]MDM7973566.1 response regulator [candidate division Zixibacteria bacterium]HOD65160.1 response regulator [candidate division Zixibacteria bacterium]HPC10545.1 response regulator [candidate division Zixibacteria bacterium]